MTPMLMYTYTADINGNKSEFPYVITSLGQPLYGGSEYVAALTNCKNIKTASSILSRVYTKNSKLKPNGRELANFEKVSYFSFP